MKNFIDKLAGVLGWIYGTTIAGSLLITALSFVGYLVAIVIGGEMAALICAVIYKQIYPVVIYMASIAVVLGLLKMYLTGEKALFSGKKK